MSDFKDTGNTQQDANVVLALFSPRRYEIEKFRGYDITKLKDRFRSISLLKNRDGDSDKTIGLQFVGEVGYFQEVPKADDFARMPELYNQVTDLTYNPLINS